ncbi:serine/threonine-protein kinase [Nocardiopsis sediminis]|uniref:Serine/threonine-protein kinase n=1 Tax=Nocardiopsis sediminis TaxID=1778267 RepID=A0ABV8FGA0_9ACTN
MIRRRIGRGGMGVVYQAVDPRQDRLVAIKVLRSEVAGDQIARARLAREVETMRRVQSDNVAGVIDADTSAELPWVVTEYIPGPTLDSTVTDHGPLRGRALTRFVSGLARAIGAIHEADVIHRDLKPGNVIISNGEPIVIDFGIAHAVDGAKLTQTGTFVGTPSYLSPEVIEGTDLSSATDIHAWGATVAFAATGNAPYGAGSFEVIFFRILNGEINLDGMPEALKPLVLSAVSRDMGARPTARRLVAETGRLNLDLPWTEDASSYSGSGLTGHHTVQAQRPDDQGEGGGGYGALAAGAAAGAAAGGLAASAMAHGAGAQDPIRTDPVDPQGAADPLSTDRTVSPDSTMAAGAGGVPDLAGSPERTMAVDPDRVDRTMAVAPADPQATGRLDPDQADPYADDDQMAPRTQFFNSTLRPEEFRDILTPVDEGRGRNRVASYGEEEDDEEGEGRRGGLLSRFGRSGGDRLSDYVGSDDEEDDYYQDEPRRMTPWILVPVLVLVAGLCLTVPLFGLVVGVLAAAVLGALDTVKADHARRLQTRGPRSSDNVVIALSLPWALLQTLGRTLLYGLGYLLVGILAGMVVALIADQWTPNNISAYAFCVTVLLSFLGPNAKGARREAIGLVGKIAIRNAYVYWGSMVAVALLAMLVVSFGFSAAPAGPFSEGPGGFFGGSSR